MKIYSSIKNQWKLSKYFYKFRDRVSFLRAEYRSSILGRIIIYQIFRRRYYSTNSSLMISNNRQKLFDIINSIKILKNFQIKI